MVDKLTYENQLLPGTVWIGKDGKYRRIISIWIEADGVAKIDFMVRSKDNQLVTYRNRKLLNFLKWIRLEGIVE